MDCEIIGDIHKNPELLEVIWQKEKHHIRKIYQQ
jgi:hypothetical protein